MNIGILVSIASFLLGGLGHFQPFTTISPNPNNVVNTPAESVEIGSTYQLVNGNSEPIVIENRLPQKVPMFLNCDTLENMNKFPITGQANAYFTFEENDLLIVDGKTRRIKNTFENIPLKKQTKPEEYGEFFNGIGDFAQVITSQDNPNILLAAIYTCKFSSTEAFYAMPLKKLLRIDLKENIATTIAVNESLRNDDGVGTFNFIYEADLNTVQIVPPTNTNLLPEKIVNYSYPMLEETIRIPTPPITPVYPIDCERSIDIALSPLVYCYTQYKSDVVAMMDGKVVETGNLLDHPWGRYIIIAHGNEMQSIYTNLATVSVQKGSTVKAGKKIGSVNTNLSTDTIFSFAMTFRGYYFNPLEKLAFNGE